MPPDATGRIRAAELDTSQPYFWARNMHTDVPTEEKGVTFVVALE